MRTNSRTFPAAEIVPASFLAPLELEAEFDRDAPLEVDLGCGDGALLVELAQQNPERNFLGVERMPGRVRGACRKIGSRGLTNARVLAADILHALQHHLAPGAVDVLYLMFPDPWPKRRHHVRRTFTRPFLEAAKRALRTGGVLRVATDDADYFEAIKAVAAQTNDFENDNQASALPQTTFGARFSERGLTIHRLVLRKR